MKINIEKAEDFLLTIKSRDKSKYYSNMSIDTNIWN